MDGSLEKTDKKTSSSAFAPALNIEVATEGENICALSFQAALKRALDFVTSTFEQEIKRKQLYYHGMDHVQGVARRAFMIFDALVPFLEADSSLLAMAKGPEARSLASDWSRQRDLLYLSAIAHDMLQLFLPQDDPHRTRQRESGRSEAATFEQLHQWMDQLNHAFLRSDCADPTGLPFRQSDIDLIREAIAATVCQLDPTEGAIYQPQLYPSKNSSTRSLSALPNISLVARCLALADIGTLGIDGIAAYQKEGSLLLLEENLDVAEFVTGTVDLSSDEQEGLRLRLLKRARFQVAFAKSRLARLDLELRGLPAPAIRELKQVVFTHLTPATVACIESTTPTNQHTSISTLLAFFQVERYLHEA